MTEKTISYQSALKEVQTIVEEIESGEISVDELSEKVKRASYLMDISREKLKGTEEEVQKILEKMEAEGKKNNTE